MAREKLEKKERMKIPRQPMPAQEPMDRIKNFSEVALGFTEELALVEADRCLECKKPKCVDGCPVGIDIPGFIVAIQQADFEGALAIIKKDNTLPAICGRVCPQEDQCEVVCVTGKKSDPVAIGRLERYVADWEMAQEGEVKMPEIAACQRVQGRGGRFRTGRSGLRRRSRAARPQGHHLRGAAQTRRRAGLRHPRVPAAQEDRPGGDRQPRKARRRDPLQLRHRQDRQRRGTLQRVRLSMRSFSAPAPVCPTSWAFPARTTSACSRPTSF